MCAVVVFVVQMSSQAQAIVPHPRGLPTVLFIEDEEAFLGKTGLSEEQAALEMRAAFQQLRQLSESLAMRREALEQKLPDTQKNLAVLRALATRKQQNKETLLQCVKRKKQKQMVFFFL